MLIIGSHVGFTKDSQLLGSLEQALSYGANAFMLYTGAPQNTIRYKIEDDLTKKAIKKMQEVGFDINNVIVHAPYIINLANNKNEEQYNFSINFLINECKRCEELGIKKMVLHPGSHVGLSVDVGIVNIVNALNKILSCVDTVILLETMAGKGTEIGSLEEIAKIIDMVKFKDRIGVCLDTCHLSDFGYDISNFDVVIEKLKSLNLLDKVGCIHVNDSKNPIGSHKDRHENLGFGYIPYEALLNVIYNKIFEDVPKILETPWIDGVAPYKEEIMAIKNKCFDKDLKENIKKGIDIP